MVSGGTALFQGIVEHMTKELTALAPSTMNFQLVAPPGVEEAKMSLPEFISQRLVNKSYTLPFHKLRAGFRGAQDSSSF